MLSSATAHSRRAVDETLLPPARVVALNQSIDALSKRKGPLLKRINLDTEQLQKTLVGSNQYSSPEISQTHPALRGVAPLLITIF